MWFSTFILKNVLRRPVRSLLTGIGVALAVGAVVGLLGISHGFERSFLQLFQRRGVDLIVQQAGVTDPTASSLDQDIGRRLREFPHVEKVTGGLMEVVGYSQPPRPAVIILGWSPESFMFHDLKIKSGRRLRAGDRRAVMLGVEAARAFGKQVGQTIEIPEGDEKFEIVGIFESFSVHENSSPIMLLSELQEIMGRENEVTGFQIVLADSDASPAGADADKGQVIEKLRRQIEDLRDDRGKSLRLSARPTREFVESTIQIRIAHAMAWLTSAIALVIGAIGMLNTMIMSVFERTREIGILRAIGWRKRRIMCMIFGESLVLCTAGAIVGTLGAVVLTRWLSTFPTVSGFILGSVSPMVIAEGFMIALLVGLVGGAYPAYRGASLSPTEAIRHE